MKKLTMKQKEKLAQEWIHQNGAASFDFHNQDIILYDGGLWSIGKKKVKHHKIIGKKKLPNGMTEILFSKNKPVTDYEYNAILWFSELHSTIKYLQRMEKFLKQLNYETNTAP